MLASGKIGKLYIFDTFWPDCVHNVCKDLEVNKNRAYMINQSTSTVYGVFKYSAH